MSASLYIFMSESKCLLSISIELAFLIIVVSATVTSDPVKVYTLIS